MSFFYNKSSCNFSHTILTIKSLWDSNLESWILTAQNWMLTAPNNTHMGIGRLTMITHLLEEPSDFRPAAIHNNAVLQPLFELFQNRAEVAVGRIYLPDRNEVSLTEFGIQ